MAKLRNGTTSIAQLVYVDPTFGDIYDSGDSDSIQANTFQTANFELDDPAFGVLDSLDFRGAVQGVSNDQAIGAANGTRWIVGSSPTGAFAAFSANQVVRSDGTTWIAEPNPSKGTLVFRKDMNKFYYFTSDTFASGVWQSMTISGLQDYRDSVISMDRLTPNAIAATKLFQTVTFTADTAGTAGNSISLVFNGTDDLATVVGAWNTANPTNTVSFTGQPGTFVPTAGTANLAGGLAAIVPVNGMRYLVGQPTATAGGAWAGHAGEIAYYDSGAATWQFEVRPDEGTMVYVEDVNAAYVFNDNTFATGLWVVFSTGIYTEGNGINISGNVISAEIGNGLKFAGSTIVVEPNDFVGSGLVDDGSDNIAIDWATVFTIDSADGKAFKASDIASTSSGKGASIVGVNDPNNVFVNNNVEQVLYELWQKSDYSTGVKYIADGAIAKGDMVYISAAGKVKKFSTITADERVVGVALVAAADTADVWIARHDEGLAGILTLGSFGDSYYWTGSGWATTMPSGAGSHVWRGGTAINATDMHLHVEYVKRNKL